LLLGEGRETVDVDVKAWSNGWPAGSPWSNGVAGGESFVGLARGAPVEELHGELVDLVSNGVEVGTGGG